MRRQTLVFVIVSDGDDGLVVLSVAAVETAMGECGLSAGIVQI